MSSVFLGNMIVLLGDEKKMVLLEWLFCWWDLVKPIPVKDLKKASMIIKQVLTLFIDAIHSERLIARYLGAFRPTTVKWCIFNNYFAQPLTDDLPNSFVDLTDVLDRG